ncbi:peptidoglycan editing factor PgeF [Spirosoma montaniterrae]|uniref:Purine nucleoside phosphorylase n=1 Tax=Spirosoma montaniterrae TaxID=1178516 RepID=A0A1P9WSX1_9BACT|nr:peptidoglycan editing factor PgeF [Spirosoma montaniterrae]AQG78484.1 polyphenol oxidoreductase [Spirosoma montaniterrae]
MTTQIVPPLFQKPTIFAPFANLIAAESTRHGGVSPAPFASLNLGINTNDDLANVSENRRRFFSAAGAESMGFASSYQVHGTEVLHATEAGRYEGYDALITNQPNLLVGVTIADCVPILIYDADKQAVAAIHAGWRGTVGGIVSKTLTAMQIQFGTQPETCYAYIGTCIDECSFEVGPEVAAQFMPTFRRDDLNSTKSFIDLKAANRQLLTDFGIPAKQIELSAYSTVQHNADYFSYRAEAGQTGRMLAAIGIKK